MGWRELELVVMAAFYCAALIMLLLPLFRRYALARPNARSSHSAPTPQGGGIAVIVAAVLALGVDSAFIESDRAGLTAALPLGAAVALLTVLGAVDDVFPIAPLRRLVVQ